MTDSLNNSSSFAVPRASGAPTYVADRHNNSNSALKVIARTNASLPLLPQGNNARSISIWFCFNSITNGEQHIFSYGTNANNQAFGFSAELYAGTVNFYGWANDIQVSYKFTSGTWYNLVVSYDGAYAVAYINGVRILNNLITSWNTNGQTFNLGESPDGSSSYNLSYDDLRIYNRVLSYQEIVAISGFSIDTNALKQSIISHYSFDTNFSNQNNDLTLTQHNTVTKVPGIKGNAVSFDGNSGLYSNDYVSVLDETSAAKPYTISFWKVDQGTNSYSTMYELFGSYYLRYRITGKLEAGYQGANSTNWYYTISPFVLLNSSDWVHYTVVHNPASGTDNVYINGINTLFFNNSNTAMNKNNSIFSIGCGTNADGTFNSSKYYLGKIDEFYLFDKALSPSEISYLYNNTDLMITGINNPSINPMISVFTNAANDELFFNADEKIKKEIWNIRGSKVSETYNKSFNINNLNHGVYIVRFVSDKTVIGSAKFIKH